MKFRYVGDPFAPHKTKFMGVVEFELGKTVEVDEKLYKEGINICQKLKGNRSFALVEEDKDALPVLDAVVEEVKSEDKPKKGKK
jgi:hypothetical protein